MQPRSLAEQLPFYQIKPAFVETLYWLTRAGLNTVLATRIVSLLFATLLSLLVYAVLARRLLEWYALIAAVLITQLAGVSYLASLASPDVMSAFFLALACYLLLKGELPVASSLMLLLSVLIRGDNLFLLLGLSVVSLAVPGMSKRSRNAILVSTALSIPAQIYVQQASGYYGWEVHFYHRFVELLNFPSHGAEVSVAQYVWQFVSGLSIHPMDSTLSAVALVAVIVLVRSSKTYDLLTGPQRIVIFGSILGSMLRYVAYPQLELRLLAGVYVVILTLLVIAALPGIHENTQASINGSSDPTRPTTSPHQRAA